MMVTRGRALTIFAALLLSLVAITPATAVPRFDAEDDALNGRHQSDTESSDEPASTPASDDSPEKPGAGSGSDAEEPPPVYVTSRELGVDSKYTCSDLHGEEDYGGGVACGISNLACSVADTLADEGDGYLASEQVRIDNRSGRSSEELLGFDCQQRGSAAAGGEGGAAPEVITVTREDFASMPVMPLVASAGPPEGWLPAHMVNVLYAESEPQTMDMTLLDTPVQVRATPVLYDWDLGDGNTISTTDPGEPYPSEAVSSTYRYEGWYDVTLTTTFSGQFSVAGGPWQDIDGTIEVASEPIPIYSKSLESRLVNPDVPVDEDEDPWVPERTAEAEGRKDPDATHREV